MPIVFVTLSESYADLARRHGYSAFMMRIEDYVPDPRRRCTYYVSPSNSLCFMDGGFDYALSRHVFPGIETEVKRRVKELGIVSFIGKPYLPIGSSLIIDGDDVSPDQDTAGHNIRRSLVMAPTMLLPQDVSLTSNAYYATMAVLYNVLVYRNENIEDVDIVFTSMCCGYGKMSEMSSFMQIAKGIREYRNYKPTMTSSNSIVIHEPNLRDQPKYYQNTEWFPIPPNEMVHC